MGTAPRFYSLDPEKKDLVITPLAPKDKWDLDITSSDGETKLCEVFDEIKQACTRLPREVHCFSYP